MAYKLIDGKVYKVEEVNAEQLSIEVDQSLRVVDEQRNRISQLEAQKKNEADKIDMQILNFQRQIEQLTSDIHVLEERKARACEPYNNEIRIAQNKIEDVKARLDEKKEIIQALLPNAYSKLGF